MQFVEAKSLTEGSRSESVEVARVIDRRVTLRQAAIALCLLSLMFCDGYDIQAIAFAAPAIAKDWGLSRAAFAPVFTAGFMGLTLGSLILSNLADRYGPKRTLVLGVSIFILFTFAVSQVHTRDEMVVMRFLSAAGMGGILPVAMSLNAEFIPRRFHATAMTLSFLGFTGGVSIGGVVAAEMIPHFGWQVMFWMGSFPPLLILLATALVVPEAPRFLNRTPKGRAKLAVFMQSVDKSLAGAQFHVPAPPPTRRLSVLDLFHKGRAVFT